MSRPTITNNISNLAKMSQNTKMIQPTMNHSIRMSSLVTLNHPIFSRITITNQNPNTQSQPINSKQTIKMNIHMNKITGDRKSSKANQDNKSFRKTHLATKNRPEHPMTNMKAVKRHSHYKRETRASLQATTSPLMLTTDGLLKNQLNSQLADMMHNSTSSIVSRMLTRLKMSRLGT